MKLVKRSWMRTGIELTILLISTIATILAIFYVRITYDGFVHGQYMPSAKSVMSPVVLLIPTLWWSNAASDLTQYRVPAWLILAFILPPTLWLSLWA